jgi:peptide deformylase
MSNGIITDQEILTQKCEPVDSYEEGMQICDKLLEVAGEYKNLVGLAAPQIGILKRVFVMIFSDGHVCFINPVLKKTNKKRATGPELCFSVSMDEEYNVRRYTKVTVRDDVNGKRIFRGFAARVWQHEMDHLEGKTLIQTGTKI